MTNAPGSRLQAQGSFTKRDLLNQLQDQESLLVQSLGQCYSNASILSGKLLRIKTLLEDPHLDPDVETIITRCPGRISLSKHADYINNDLLYTLDDRDVYLAAQVTDQKKLLLINHDPKFANHELDLDQEPLDKSDWSFYPLELVRKLKPDNDKGLALVYSSDLPPGGGLSSSHALMLASFIALVELFDIQDYKEALKTRDPSDPKIFEIILLCQNVEHARGFSSGLGDQSAQLLSLKNKFSFIKLYPKLQVEYRDIPDDLGIITAPSFIKADKSLPEFQAANENIKAYKEINQLAQQYDCNYLGDLLYKYSEAEIFKILESIDDIKIKGLALYGLAEGARVRELKQSQELNIEDLGAHLNLSHLAERNFKPEDWQAINQEDKFNYEFDPTKPLGEHSGSYLASTLANDQLQYLANQIEGVYGSSISGAGLGGNNSIICDKNKSQEIKQTLLAQYYRNQKLESDAQQQLHINSSSAACSKVI